MKLNEDLIREYVNKSNDILCKYIPNYEPINPMTLKVKISKMKSAWANIKRIRIGRICHYELKVSDIFNYIDNDSKAEMKLMSTIIHEVIHTIPGCFNHGVNFQACAYMISSKTCYKITTSANSVYVGVSEESYSKYMIQCLNCNHKYYYQRRPKNWDNVSKYECTICGHKSFKKVEL